MAGPPCRPLGPLSPKRGLQDSFFSPAPIISCSSGFSFLPGEQGEIRGASVRGVGNDLEECYRGDSRPGSGFLQPPVPSQESLGDVEACPRRLQAKRVRFQDQVFHGDHPVSPRLYSERGLDDLHGHEGRLFSHPYSRGVEAISQVHIQQQSVPVSGSVLWSEHGSSSLHQGSCSSSKDYSSSRIQDTAIPRRLAGNCKLQGGVVEGKGIYSGLDKTIRHIDQLGEITTGTLPSDRLSRNDNKLEFFLGFSNHEKSRQRLINDHRISVLRRTACEILAKSPRPYVVPGEIYSWGKAQDATSSISSPLILGQEVTKDLDLGSPSSRPGFSLVGQPIKTQSRHLPREEEPRATVILRRVSRGLGSCNRGTSSVGEMVFPREGKPHQPSRTQGNMAGSSGSSSLSQRQDHCGLFGQSDGPGLYFEAGRHKISSSVRSCERPLDLVREQSDLVDAPVHQWGEECSSRRPQQEGSSSPHGMDAPSGSMSEALAPVGSTSHRPVCHKPDEKTSPVLLPSFGPSGTGDRRPSAVLVQRGSLCLPSFRHHQEGDQQAQRVKELQNDSHRPLVAPKRMVPRSSQTRRRGTKAASSQTGSSLTASGEGSTSKPPHASLDRMETLHSFVRHKKLSSKVSKYIYEARGSNTNYLYQQRWATFVSWCRARKLSASRPSISSICEFLIYLFEEKKMAVGTIRGYRCTLHSVLRHNGLRINTDEDISDVIKAFKIKAPNRPNRVVHWNLDVLLKYLCSNKFEPLRDSSLLNLTKKTLILVALALSKRISELQALARPVGFSPEGALLSLALDFRAKNDIKCQRLSRDFLIKDLVSLVGQEEEALLCPVRALKEYVKRTSELTQLGVNRLFVSPRCPTKPASKNALTFLIKSVIKEAHTDLRPDLIPILKVKSHELRAVSTSVAFTYNLSLNSVMQAAQWRCNSVFASHYLKEVAFVYNDCRTLGPLLVAGTVVT